MYPRRELELEHKPYHSVRFLELCINILEVLHVFIPQEETEWERDKAKYVLPSATASGARQNFFF